MRSSTARTASPEVAIPGSGAPIGLASTTYRPAATPTLLTPAARKGIRQRMLLMRQASVQRLARLAGVSEARVHEFRRALLSSGLPDQLIQRGAGLAFAQELPQGPLVHLLVRALEPDRVVETGVRPGYSTAWILSALEANGRGALSSLGPGPVQGRASGVQNVSVGQFVPPNLRTRWTLVLGNTEENLRALLETGGPVDLFLYDNGPATTRARFELRTAWGALSPRGVLLAHHIEANSAWSEFCAAQGLTPQLLDPGPPPMGALGLRTRAEP
jgi:methyltransferase family protein